MVVAVVWFWQGWLSLMMVIDCSLTHGFPRVFFVSFLSFLTNLQSLPVSTSRPTSGFLLAGAYRHIFGYSMWSDLFHLLQHNLVRNTRRKSMLLLFHAISRVYCLYEYLVVRRTEQMDTPWVGPSNIERTWDGLDSIVKTALVVNTDRTEWHVVRLDTYCVHCQS